MSQTLGTLSLAALAMAPGLAVGSFLNVIVSRVPTGRSIGLSRSACPACDHAIRWHDNVPLLSFALLRGRCRDCGTPIPARYPLVEGMTALLTVACLLRFGLTAYAVLAAGFCAVLVVISAIDVEHRVIPNAIVLPAAAATLAAHTLIDPTPEWALAALAAFGVFLLLAIAYPAGMGMGDVKLCLLLGAMLGWQVFVGIFLGVLASLVPAAVLAVAHGRAARRMTIPFGPFLAGGAIVALLFGEAIVSWYGGLFG
jgi:leader peptidase (prepilin peptidase)/N-methyltransferase